MGAANPVEDEDDSAAAVVAPVSVTEVAEETPRSRVNEGVNIMFESKGFFGVSDSEDSDPSFDDTVSDDDSRVLHAGLSNPLLSRLIAGSLSKSNSTTSTGAKSRIDDHAVAPVSELEGAWPDDGDGLLTDADVNPGSNSRHARPASALSPLADDVAVAGARRQTKICLSELSIEGLRNDREFGMQVRRVEGPAR